MERLFVESHLPVDPATAWRLFESDDFRARFAGVSGLRGRVVEETVVDRVTHTRLQFVSERELPSVVTAFVGTDAISYEQTNQFDPDKGTLAWQVHIPALSERVVLFGTTTIHDDPDGCHRIVEGEVTIQVAVVGPRIEKIVASEFHKSMLKAVAIVEQMIEDEELD